ncbi:MAG: DEAD/DEAH box helicase, partial [Armatimonadaceae bacterium]
MPRVLWLAHRRELLAQAATALRQGFPDARFAWLVDGNRPRADFDFLLASVQSLSRSNSLASFEPAHFDYLVVDEVHHADAASYRRILAHFTPQFLLGLTATPERGDGGDVAGLFDDYVAFRADLAAGIESGNLVPFAYFGLADTTDYSNIPWRSGRFDPEELSVAIETQARMETLWDAWNDPGKPGSRTLVFCASVRHAEFVQNWLRDRGVRVRLCHGGNGSDDRELALLDLEAGRIDAICSVDLFNEGIDCRPVDRVVMLRPTESPVVFLQQLGRGLRTAMDKTQLVVVDFVGNHRVFLNRLRTLLTAAGSGNGVAQFVHFGLDSALPSGCSIRIELTAIDFLKQLVAGSGSKSRFVSAYREWRWVYEERPTAGEMIRQGFGLRDIPTGAGSWFGWLIQENELGPAVAAVATKAADWLRDVSTTDMTKCFKMVV